jgi:hypothetical protein
MENISLTELEIDLLVEMIIQNDDLVFEKNVETNIIKYKKKIIDSIITNNYIDSIPKLKKIYSSDLDTSNIILDSLLSIVRELDLDSYKWIITNEPTIFNDFISRLSYNDFMTIINSENFFPIYKVITESKNINVFKNKIVVFINYLISDNMCMYKPNPDELEFFKTFEKIILLIDTYLSEKKTNDNFQNIHSRIIILLLKASTSLDIIFRYKKYYKITDENLKNLFEKKIKMMLGPTHLPYLKETNILVSFIEFISVEIMTWIIELSSISEIINSSNYIDVFDRVCLSRNIELIKLTYNLIQCAGFTISNSHLESIIHNLIYKGRWNNQYNNIIYEFINMGAQPPSSASKYNDYYKNITIIKK